MGSAGLERGFALVVGSVLIVLGLAGSVGNPIVGRPGTTGVFVTGFGHDLVHLVCGALFLHVGIALTGRQRAYGLVGLGVFFVLTGLLSLVSSDLIGLYEIGELPSQFAAQVEVLQRACQLTAEAMPRLRTMKDLEEYWIEINRLENQGDRSYRRILADLFSGSYKSLEVLKLKDVVDSIEHAIDALESVANTVEQIAVKES